MTANMDECPMKVAVRRRTRLFDLEREHSSQGRADSSSRGV
jgi:hypothetical protein